MSREVIAQYRSFLERQVLAWLAPYGGERPTDKKASWRANCRNSCAQQSCDRVHPIRRGEA